MTNQIWLPTIYSSSWLVSRTFSYEGWARAAAGTGKMSFSFFSSWVNSRIGYKVEDLQFHHDNTVKCQIDSHSPWVCAKAHVLEHACWLIQHAVKVGVYYCCEARLACTASLTLTTEIQDLPLDNGERKGETKEEEQARVRKDAHPP